MHLSHVMLCSAACPLKLSSFLSLCQGLLWGSMRMLPPKKALVQREKDAEHAAWIIACPYLLTVWLQVVLDSLKGLTG